MDFTAFLQFFIHLIPTEDPDKTGDLIKTLQNLRTEPRPVLICCSPSFQPPSLMNHWLCFRHVTAQITAYMLLLFHSNPLIGAVKLWFISHEVWEQLLHLRRFNYFIYWIKGRYFNKSIILFKMVIFIFFSSLHLSSCLQSETISQSALQQFTDQLSLQTKNLRFFLGKTRTFVSLKVENILD